MNRSYLLMFYVLASFFGVLLFLFYGTSQLLAFFKTGANQADMLLLSTEHINDFYQPKISWINVGENKGRVMEPGTLQKISRDYVASYYYQYRAIETGDPLSLHDYFTEKTRAYMNRQVDYHTNSTLALNHTTVEHVAEVEFYSADGSLVTLNDQVISYQQMQADAGKRFKRYDTSSYRVAMLLEDNYWRIRHKVRTSQFPNRLMLPDSLAIHTRPVVRKGVLEVGHKPYKILGINYYPQNYPWQEMWTNFDSIDFQSDFQLIDSLGFNTLRVFVPFHLFGGASVDPEMLDRLHRLLDVAAEAQLKVIITLFDFFLGYPMDEWSLSDRHLEQVIGKIREHPALLAWDIKNEPDLDFESSGREGVIEWLQFAVRRVRRFDPDGLVTIGWSQPELVDVLSDELDFLSFHFYRSPNELIEFFDRRGAGEKPLYLGETGKHTFSSWWYPFKSDEEEQVDYLANVMDVVRTYDMHYAVWTLYDFKNIPSNVAGRWPWQKGPQKAYGLISGDDKAKKILYYLNHHNKNLYNNDSKP